MLTLSGREVYDRLAKLPNHALTVCANAAEARACAELAAAGHVSDLTDPARIAARLVEVSHFSREILDDLDALARAARQSVGSDLVVMTIEEADPPRRRAA